MTNLNPVNSRSLYKTISDVFAQIDEIDPTDDLDVNGVKLGKINSKIKAAETLLKIFDSELKFASLSCEVEQFQNKFRNPQLKNYESISIQENKDNESYN